MSTRERVEAAIAELGYRRNTAARSLVTRQSQTIGVLGSELAQYGPANTLLGVEQAARDAGYFVSIAALRTVSREAIFDCVRAPLKQHFPAVQFCTRKATVKSASLGFRRYGTRTPDPQAAVPTPRRA